MQLSSSYRCVKAVIDPPQGGGGYIDSDSDYANVDFRIGLLEYTVSISPEGGRGYSVGFELSDIHGSRAQLREYLSLIFKRELSIEQALALRKQLLRNSESILGVGNAGKVLGNVMAITQEFVSKHRPRYLTFTTLKTEESKTSLYPKMLKRFFPTSAIRIEDRGSYNEFYVDLIYKKGK